MKSFVLSERFRNNILFTLGNCTELSSRWVYYTHTYSVRWEGNGDYNRADALP